MTTDNETLTAHLAGLIKDCVRLMERDGYANSKAHGERFWKCAVAIEDLAEGREAELPI